MFNKKIILIFLVMLLVLSIFVVGWTPLPPEYPWEDEKNEDINSGITYEPQKKLLISKIRTNQLAYNELKPGDLLFINLKFENIGKRNTKYTTIRITVPELGISRKLGPFRGPEIDEAMSRDVYLEIPEYAKPGVYTVRISLSDLSGVRITRHRDFRVVR